MFHIALQYKTDNVDRIGLHLYNLPVVGTNEGFCLMHGLNKLNYIKLFSFRLEF